MKKFSTLLIAFAVVAICCVFLLPTEAQAASSGTCGDNLTWTLDDEGTLTISGTGAMRNDWYDSTPWYSKLASIKSVVIEEGVTTIGNYAFYGCTSLTSITIPGSVTRIGSNAFRECWQLESVVIPEGVTSIGAYAFGTDYNIYNLKRIHIPSTLTNIDEWGFYGCYEIEEVHIIDITSWMKISKGSASWDSPTADTGSLFINGTKVTDIVIPEGFQEIPDYAFAYCRGISKVTFSDGVIGIGKGAFANCGDLEQIELNNVSIIKQDAFINTRLGRVTMPNHIVDFDNSAFSASGIEFYASPDNLFYSTDEQCALYNKDKTVLISMPTTHKDCIIPASVQQIRDGAINTVFGHTLFLGTKEQWDKIDIGEDNFIRGLYYEYIDGVDFHTWKKGGTVKEATCQDEGEERYYCSECRISKTVTVEKMDHIWDEGVEIKKPTGGETGIMLHICTSCGGAKTEEIPALGMSPEPTEPGVDDPSEPVEPGEDKEEGGFFAAIAAFFEAIFRVLFFFLYL